MSTGAMPDIIGQLSEMRSMLHIIMEKLDRPATTRAFYTVEEAARLLSRTPYTVREWCRQGRINAVKRTERRGGATLWSIAAAEIERFKNEGLLPPDPRRNA